MLYFRETHFAIEHAGDDEKCVMLGESPLMPIERSSTIGEFFRAVRGEYGACTGKVYIDRPDAPNNPQHVGWIFRAYKGSNERDDRQFGDRHLHETWVTVYTAPARTVYEYADLDSKDGIAKKSSVVHDALSLALDILSPLGTEDGNGRTDKAVQKIKEALEVLEKKP